jgi:hypothetical protein
MFYKTFSWCNMNRARTQLQTENYPCYQTQALAKPVQTTKQV